jgi:hypothetical protein
MRQIWPFCATSPSKQALRSFVARFWLNFLDENALALVATTPDTKLLELKPLFLACWACSGPGGYRHCLWPVLAVFRTGHGQR